VLFFHDERFYPGFFINPVFLDRPRLFDDFNPVWVTEKERYGFLLHSNFKTSVINTGFIEVGKIGVLLNVFVDLFLFRFDEGFHEEAACDKKAQTE
jgi:hypothetical protein